MGWFLTGFWTAIIVALWIWMLVITNVKGIIILTLLIIITAFFTGVATAIEKDMRR
jgi:uncharacterized membrane protein